MRQPAAVQLVVVRSLLSLCVRLLRLMLGAVQMIEIGNGVFTAEQSPQALAMAQTHMTCKCKDITEFGV